MNRADSDYISPENYIKVHESYMTGFYERKIVLEDNLEFERVSTEVMTLIGAIILPGDLKLYVEKYFVIQVSDNRTEYMVTTSYDYQLSFAGYSSSDVFRYDNDHVHSTKGHSSEFHKHEFDPPGTQKKGFPIEIGFLKWPPLNLVIEEAYQYFLDYVETGKVDIAKLGKKRESAPLALRGEVKTSEND